jgi:hypothetical protein
MKGGLGEAAARRDRNEADRVRVKTSPGGGQNLAESPKRPPQETIMIFNYEQYPFPNSQAADTSLLKTIVNLELGTEKLEKVIKLAHPNIVGLRKIVRSSPK